MSAIRRSSRITEKSSINVKLNASENVEFVDVNEGVENMDEMDEVDEWTAEIIDDEDEGDEELICNPDGTMTIKMASKSNGTKKDSIRLDCGKCGLSFPTEEVNFAKFNSDVSEWENLFSYYRR